MSKTADAKEGWDIFISHSSKNKPVAARMEKGLEKAGVKPWVDHANLRAGGLLLDDLQHALAASAKLALLWSKPASESRYVSAEWQAAFHMEKEVIPCLLDDTPLPPFLLRYLNCDFRQSFQIGLTKLIKAVGGRLVVTRNKAAKKAAKKAPKPGGGISRIREELTNKIVEGQNNLLLALQNGLLPIADLIQNQIDPDVSLAVRHYPKDPMLLNLAGYHNKNAYMIKHWQEVQGGQSPPDKLLEQAEKMFFSALSVRPDDESALNGLGSVLIMRGDLDAAEFFVRQALDKARKDNQPYAAAEHDLKLIERLKKERQGN